MILIKMDTILKKILKENFKRNLNVLCSLKLITFIYKYHQRNKTDDLHDYIYGRIKRKKIKNYRQNNL